MFETDYVAEFQSIIDDLQPKYKCIKAFRTIEVDDIVHVKTHYNNIHNPVYITKNCHTHCTNLDMLDTHFIKL